MDADAWGWPSGLHGRPAEVRDEPFLRHAHAQVRLSEWGASGLDEHPLAPLLAMQFEAQRQGYMQQRPGCAPWIVEQQERGASQPVGTMWLHADAKGLCLMDMAVLPAHRRQGVATGCLLTLMRHCDAQGWAMHLHVAADNPVRGWYARWGFVETGVDGLHVAMTRVALEQEAHHEQA